MSILICIEFTY